MELVGTLQWMEEDGTQFFRVAKMEQDFANTMPPHLSPIFRRLHADTVALFIRWITFRQLYATNSLHVCLLNQCAPGFFGIIQNVLIDDLLTGIVRITDKPATAGKNNLVLRQLRESLDTVAHASLIEDLRHLLNRK
jgi:hypothetical protein